MQPLRPLQTLGPLQLVLALEPIVINITATANKEIYVITAIKSIQTIMTITANAVITAMMAITAITDIIGPLQLVLALEAILGNTTTTANREMYVTTVI